MLAFFASFIDIIESNIDRLILVIDAQNFLTNKTGSLLSLIEEVGEISVICLICIWLFDIASNRKLLSKRSKKST